MTTTPDPPRGFGRLTLERDVRNVAPLLERLCEAECDAAATRQRVALYVDLRPVFLPTDHRIVLELACRSILLDALGRASRQGQSLAVGVHFWRTKPPAEAAARLLVASTAPTERENPQPEPDGLGRARDAVQALGGACTCEAGSVWRVTLPLPPLAAFVDPTGSPAPR